MGQYDFGQLYGQADSSIFTYEPGEYDAVVESSTWGRTKDGAKGQWDVRFRVSTGPNAGRAQVKMPMTVTADNPQALGIMFRHLEALGIPANWLQSNPPEEQIAQAMVGKPVLLKIVVDEYEGIQRNKVRDVRAPRPGAPLQWPQYQPQQQAPAPYGAPGYGQPQGYGMPQQPQYQDAAPAPFPPQQPQYAQPQYPGAPAPYGGPQQPPAAPAPSAPWQQPQAAPAVNGGQSGGNPAVPPWAQPPVPGAGGTGEFTGQGQSQQPSVMQPQFQAPQPQGYAPVPPPQYAQPQAPAAPGPLPWNGQQPAAAAQQGPADPQAAPPPPWAQ